MANIATGYLEIIFDKNSELNKTTVDEIISTIENNNHFIYGGDCEGIFNKEERSIDFNFTCRWSGEYATEMGNFDFNNQRNKLYQHSIREGFLM